MLENTLIYTSNKREFPVVFSVEFPVELMRFGFYECFPHNHRIKFIIELRKYNPNLPLIALNHISKQIWEEWRHVSLMQSNVSKEIPL